MSMSINPLRSFRFAYARLAGRLALIISRADVGSTADAIGAPVVDVYRLFLPADEVLR